MTIMISIRNISMRDVFACIDRSRSEPVGETQGRPFIEKFLLEQRRNERAASEIKSLRAAAAIQYLGTVIAAPAATSSPTPSATDVNAGIAAGLK